MQIHSLSIKDYKNLKNFKWVLNEEHRNNVLIIIGQNGAGKSNLLEALILIFDSIYHQDYETQKIVFSIRFQCNGRNIQISNNKSDGDLLEYLIDNKKYSYLRGQLTGPEENKISLLSILPSSISCYYSGFSNRLNKICEPIMKRQGQMLRKGSYTATPPIVKLDPMHYQMIILGLFAFGKEFSSVHSDFLLKYFHIEELHSFKIHIGKHSNWVKDKEYKNFFDTNGAVRYAIGVFDKVFRELYRNTDPKSITAKRNDKHTYYVEYEFKHADDILKLREEVSSEYEIFNLLNIIYHSDNLWGIEIMIKKNGVVNPIPFDNLSEGEQQQIAIRGLIELQRGKENLFLWDEPDTYLNPRWQWDLIPSIKEQIEESIEDQIIATTHSSVLLSTAKNGAWLLDENQLKSLPNTYGLTIDETLIKQGIQIELEKPKEEYEEYIELISQGRHGEERTVELHNLLESRYDSNDSRMIRAKILETYYQSYEND